MSANKGAWTIQSALRYSALMNSRVRRLSTAIVAVFALLISQLAVSAHVCEMMGISETAARTASGDCPQLDTANLCNQHCQFGQSAVDPGKPLPTADLTSGPALYIHQPYPASVLATQLPRELPLPPEPPPAIRFSVLQI
jgi:hypothetical protein